MGWRVRSSETKILSLQGRANGSLSNSSRKYYFVQISTGKSQWEIPTTEAPLGASPAGTPAQGTDPYNQPPGEGDPPQDGPAGERGFGVSVQQNPPFNSSTYRPAECSCEYAHERQ